MAKNKNKQNDEGRQAPDRAEGSDESPRKASSGKQSGAEKGASKSGNAGTNADRSRTEPNQTDESARQAKGRPTTERENLDVDDLDEQNQEL